MRLALSLVIALFIFWVLSLFRGKNDSTLDVLKRSLALCVFLCIVSFSLVNWIQCTIAFIIIVGIYSSLILKESKKNDKKAI